MTTNPGLRDVVLRAPPRYEPIERLGRGGGGEVWSVRDRISGETVAFKVIGDGSSDEEMLALVREAVALSGLEGLGAPRVLRFGRLQDGRAYLVRDLVVGRSLAELAASKDGGEKAVAAVADAADQLTRLHRADLLHGDVKPANIIVGAHGVRFVDLGLAARFLADADGLGEEAASGGGAHALGMTPKYAAPELLAGGPLTIRAEVFALGKTLREVLDRAGDRIDKKLRAALADVAAKATEGQPATRYPSAEEFSLAVRQAAGLEESPETAPGTSRTARALASAPRGIWPILALDLPTDALATRIAELPPSRGLVVAGPPGSGRTTLLRRVAWSLGVRDAHVAHVEARGLVDPVGALEIELAPYDDIASVLLLIDDFHELSPLAVARVDELRRQGARLAIVTGGESVPELSGPTFGVYQVPALTEDIACELVHRAMPSLGEGAALHVVRVSEARPGRLREIVDLLGGTPVVTVDDVDRAIATELALRAQAASAASKPDLEAIRNALDRGHFDEAGDLLARTAGERNLELAVAWSRLATNRGEARRALAELAPYEAEALASFGLGPAEWALHAARAHLRAGEYEKAEARGRVVAERLGDLRGSGNADLIEAESLSVVGLALGFMGRFDEAVVALRESIAIADRAKSARVLSLAYGSLGFVLQKFEKLDEARGAYTDALVHAERAGDAGSVATTRLNLATIAKTRGDLGDALVHLEAAVDMGKRSGRISTLRMALVNLANIDLFIGRVAKAATSISELAREREGLPKQLGARLLSLEAEAAERSGDPRAAYELCGRAAAAYDEVGHAADAAEARLWGVLFALDLPVIDLGALRADVEAARAALPDGTGPQPRPIANATVHHALLEVAEGRLLLRNGDLEAAASAFDRAIAAAERERLREWRVQALEARADVAARQGDAASAKRMREEAVTILEAIASELPRDLAEVFWNDDRRRTLRAAREAQPSTSQSVAMDRVGRVLEINREIAGTYDLPRLLERITDHAVALLHAERGFVILKSRRAEAAEGALSVHASREAPFTGGETFRQSGGSLYPVQGDGDVVAHTRFSRSIADRVIATGEPVVTTSAREDARTAGYVSVHQLMLESIACVPIRSRTAGIIGALYLETRLRPGNRFKAELPLLVAFADQVAIAIETARLVSENEKRTTELARANQELEAARSRLADTLDHRTAQLQATRKDLKSTRAVLKGHFGYEGLVGTSDAMRRLYALIDRVKDTDVPVLITGESGTGKEMVARAIHNGGARGKKTFVGINCGAVPEHLLESELFGHVKGAFTGAERDRRGLFREATDGTLLLDEIGEMGSKMQAALLRVLQEKMVRPLGSAIEEPTGARVIAATHRDLASLVQSGSFREDLYYRLNVIPVTVPPLRDRIDDIPILIDHFLGIFAARYSRDRRSVSRDAKKLLMSYRWPGNVRQLENALLNAWVLSDAPELEPEDFSMFEPARVAAAASAPAAPPRKPAAPASPPRAAAPTSLEQHRNDERERIVAALASSNWNRVKAAEIVGMPRRTFYRRLKEYGIQ